MKNNIQDKAKLVNSVFSKVYKKYDLMNDVMSLGIHRIWKEKYISWLNPSPNSKLIDVASGTGDIAKLFSNYIDHSAKITCVEPNKEMLEEGKKNLKKYKNIEWIKATAEALPVKDNSFDKLLAVNVVYFLHPIIDYAREFFRILKINGLGVLVCKFEGIKNFDEKVAPNKNLEDIVKAFEKAGFGVKTEFIKSNNTQKEYHAIYLRKNKNEL